MIRKILMYGFHIYTPVRLSIPVMFDEKSLAHQSYCDTTIPILFPATNTDPRIWYAQTRLPITIHKHLVCPNTTSHNDTHALLMPVRNLPATSTYLATLRLLYLATLSLLQAIQDSTRQRHLLTRCPKRQPKQYFLNTQAHMPLYIFPLSFFLKAGKLHDHRVDGL